MKKLLFAAMLLAFFNACDLDEDPNMDVIKDPINGIIAGQLSGTDLFYSRFFYDTLFLQPDSTAFLRLIDINDDGVMDFELLAGIDYASGQEVIVHRIAPLDSNEIAIPEMDSLLADTINAFAVINAELQWSGQVALLQSCIQENGAVLPAAGLWNNVTDKYIGTRVRWEDRILYGWIRVEITDCRHLTLVDYASINL